VAQQLWRAGRIRERSHEQITRGSVMIATQGRVVGQVNGLSVLALGDFAFGQPTRITATARPGSGQAVGGVNEKIEGFFDVCVARGELAGQAVILPATNVEHLMLKREVREAMEAGRFRIFAVRHVDEALALLTGETLGEGDEAGNFPAESLNGRVQARLARFQEVVKAASGNGDEQAAEGGEEGGDDA